MSKHIKEICKNSKHYFFPNIFLLGKIHFYKVMFINM